MIAYFSGVVTEWHDFFRFNLYPNLFAHFSNERLHGRFFSFIRPTEKGPLVWIVFCIAIALMKQYFSRLWII